MLKVLRKSRWRIALTPEEKAAAAQSDAKLNDQTAEPLGLPVPKTMRIKVYRRSKSTSTKLAKHFRRQRHRPFDILPRTTTS